MIISVGALLCVETLELIMRLMQVEIKNIFRVKGTFVSVVVPLLRGGVLETQSGNGVPANLDIIIWNYGSMTRAYMWISSLCY